MRAEQENAMHLCLSAQQPHHDSLLLGSANHTGKHNPWGFVVCESSLHPGKGRKGILRAVRQELIAASRASLDANLPEPLSMTIGLPDSYSSSSSDMTQTRLWGAPASDT